MALAAPAFAIVRPRVVVTRTGEARLLDDVVAEIVEEYGSGFVRLCGGSGSGKTTALAHLAAVFSHNDNILFLDEPTPNELETCSSESVTIAAMPSGSGRNLELALQPWGIDELIEYLLAEHHDACGSVIERLGTTAKARWLPELACVVLDRFAGDSSLVDPEDALMQEIRSQLSTAKQQLAVESLCVFMKIGTIKEWETAQAKVAKTGVPDQVRGMLRHSMVQLPLAGSHLAERLEGRQPWELERLWPAALIDDVGRRCAERDSVLNKLRGAIDSPWSRATQATAASVLCVAQPGWKPEAPRRPWEFQSGVFCNAHWNGVNLFRANLRACDFTGADLSTAKLESANAEAAVFVEARLQESSMIQLSGTGADFRRANLERAKLSKAKLDRALLCEANLSGADLQQTNLSEADLTGAKFSQADLRMAKLIGAKLGDTDFTDADLRGADLSGVDLRSVTLHDACLEGTVLKAVQWEDSHLLNARLMKAKLTGAHLTGTSFPAANLSGADLQRAGLAEIDWEGADLSGADLRESTFHLGSSRSGLVGSTIACEGSKTGFYTDDFEDMTFKRPEEIRKANLRRADLRGVKADGVDFYLVDLRDAKLDQKLLEQAQGTGAILYDREP
jgi:uncharacterized protein YjbI with pentapeptide repeats